MNGQIVPNTGRSKLTEMQKVQRLVENGVNVYILRWKKLNAFPVTMFGFDDVVLQEGFDASIGAVTYEAVPVKGSAVNFMTEKIGDIPTAYVPDTPKNRKMLVSMLTNAPFIIAGKATFGAVQPSLVAVQELSEYAKTLPVVKEKKWIVRDINGQVISDKGQSVTPEKSATAELCFEAAEKQVHEKNETFCKHLRKKHGSNNWKRIKDYKEAIYPEVVEAYHEKLALSGLKDTLGIVVEDKSSDEPDTDPKE